MNKNIIGNRINSALTNSGKKQKELAAVLGVTDNTVSYYVNGKRTPSIDHIIVMTSFFDVSSDYLLGISDIPNTTVEGCKAYIEGERKLLEIDRMRTAKQLEEISVYLSMKCKELMK